MNLSPRTDIGVNLLHKRFDRDRDAVLARARAAGVTRMLITCTDLPQSMRGIEFCRARHDALWCTAGVHPHDAQGVQPGWLADLETLAREPEVKAVGEMGLDFNRNFSPPDKQIEVFLAQLELARAVGKPAFVHDRDSDTMVFQMLSQHAEDLPGVVVHCFTGTRQDAANYISAGFYIGITGWVCDERRGQPLRDIVTDIPLDRLLIETDAPFLIPHNAPADLRTHGDKKRNEPALLNCVIDKLGELYGCDAETIAQATHRNASILFGLPEGS